MYATTIIAYAYEAALHCPDCTAMRFTDFIGKDNEGNEITPVFAGEFDGELLYCDDCRLEVSF